MNPFYEEEFKWWDIELYNAVNAFEMGDMADIKKFGSDHKPDLKQVAAKAKELGYDSFCIKERVEIQKDYNVESFGDLDG